MIKTKKQMFIVISVFALILMLGTVTYAFFNYTRTGLSNSIKVGRISFVSRQTDTINLTNLFPIDPTNSSDMNDSTKVGTVEIEIEGDTDYAEGVEYLISSVDSSITTNGKTLPISLDITVTTLGTESSSYWTARESKNATIYKRIVGETLEGNQMLLVGFIKKNTTGGTAEGVDGSITIKAYLDKNKILISDTYNNGETPTDNLGTPASLGEGKTVFTTTEWNALQNSGVSFKVKVEADEGIWVEEPVPATCPGANCKYMYTTNTYQYGGANNVNATQVSTLIEVTTDYTTLNTNYFIGFTETQDGKIDRAFACGIKGENPNQGTIFCVEGSTDGSTYIANNTFLNDFFGLYDGSISVGCRTVGSYTSCDGIVGAYVNDDGFARVDNNAIAYYSSGCYVYDFGEFECD